MTKKSIKNVETEEVVETPEVVEETVQAPKYPFPITNVEEVIINGKTYTHVHVQEGNGVVYELSNLPPKYKDLVKPFLKTEE